MATTTPNLSLNKPTLLGDQDIWGSLLNDNFDILDSEIPSRIAQAISDLIDGAPALLDTLNEIAAAIADDEDFATTITNQLALKAPLGSPVFTGVPEAPTAPADDNSTKIANTAFVQSEITDALDSLNALSFDAVVDAGGGADYTTIEAATAGEAVGAKIFIKNGLYQPLAIIEVKDGQYLIGESREGVIVDYQGTLDYIKAGNHATGGLLKKTSVTVTFNSNTITGVWGASEFNIGDTLYVDGHVYNIETVGVNTATVDGKWLNATNPSEEILIMLNSHKNIMLANFTMTNGHTNGKLIHLFNAVSSVIKNVSIIDGVVKNAVIIERVFEGTIHFESIKNMGDGSGNAIELNVVKVSDIRIEKAQNNYGQLRMITNGSVDIEVVSDFCKIFYKGNFIAVSISGKYNVVEFVSESVSGNELTVRGEYNVVRGNVIKGTLFLDGLSHSIYLQRISSVDIQNDTRCSIHGADILAGGVLGTSTDLLLVGCTIKTGVTLSGVGTNTASSKINY